MIVAEKLPVEVWNAKLRTKIMFEGEKKSPEKNHVTSKNHNLNI